MLKDEIEHVEQGLEEIPAAAVEQVEKVADTLEDAAEQASEAAKEATNPHEHEVLAGVSEALQLLRAELKRANDLREFETKQAQETVATNSEIAAAPVAEVVEDVKPRYVRRGGRKVKAKK